jgi:hypothetical protein
MSSSPSTPGGVARPCSSIALNSTPGIGRPTEPALWNLGVLIETTGDVSVRP